MCFCLLVELDVFVLFCTSPGNGNVFHQKLAFSWRGTKRTKKTKDFGVFFVFFGTSSGNGNVFHQKLAFSWRGTKKTKKNKDFGLFRPRLRQDSKIFVFLDFLVPPQEMATFSTKSLHFPGGVRKKTKKNKDFGLFRPRLRQDSKIFVFFVFLVPPQEMATFSTKSLHFPGGVRKKNQKKPKILDSSGLAFAKSLKSLFFLVFWYLLRKWQRFPPKACIFLKMYKDFGLFRPRLRQDSKIFVFFVFLVPPQEMATFSTKSLHFPGGVRKKTKKNQRFWTLQASPSPRL